MLCVECWCGLLCSGRGFLFVCTLLVGVWAQVAPVGWSFLLLYGVGAVFVLRSQPGISRLEGRVVTGRCFVCCPGFPLPALDFSLGIFVERLCLCFSRRRWRLAASNALLALRRLFGSKVLHLATLLSPGLASFFHDVVGCVVDCSGFG